MAAGDPSKAGRWRLGEGQGGNQTQGERYTPGTGCLQPVACEKTVVDSVSHGNNCLRAHGVNRDPRSGGRCNGHCNRHFNGRQAAGAHLDTTGQISQQTRPSKPQATIQHCDRAPQAHRVDCLRSALLLAGPGCRTRDRRTAPPPSPKAATHLGRQPAARNRRSRRGEIPEHPDRSPSTALRASMRLTVIALQLAPLVL